MPLPAPDRSQCDGRAGALNGILVIELAFDGRQGGAARGPIVTRHSITSASVEISSASSSPARATAAWSCAAALAESTTSSTATPIGDRLRIGDESNQRPAGRRIAGPVDLAGEPARPRGGTSRSLSPVAATRSAAALHAGTEVPSASAAATRVVLSRSFKSRHRAAMLAARKSTAVVPETGLPQLRPSRKPAARTRRPNDVAASKRTVGSISLAAATRMGTASFGSGAGGDQVSARQRSLSRSASRGPPPAGTARFWSNRFS